MWMFGRLDIREASLKRLIVPPALVVSDSAEVTKQDAERDSAHPELPQARSATRQRALAIWNLSVRFRG
jgi:hypothetical protein